MSKEAVNIQQDLLTPHFTTPVMCTNGKQNKTYCCVNLQVVSIYRILESTLVSFIRYRNKRAVYRICRMIDIQRSNFKRDFVIGIIRYVKSPFHFIKLSGKLSIINIV